MEQVDFFSAWQVTFKSNGPDKKEEPNAMKTSECKKVLTLLLSLLHL